MTPIKTGPKDVKRAAPKKRPVPRAPAVKTLRPTEAPPVAERTVKMPRTGRTVQLSPEQARARQNAAAIGTNPDARRRASLAQRRDSYLWNWVHGSNRKNSVLMKRAAIREFKLRGIEFNPRGFKFAGSEVALAAKDLRKLYDATQAEFRRRGIKTVKLFRGIKGPVAQGGALESWTTSRKVAEKFGTYSIIEKEIPVEQILTGRGLPDWIDGIFGNQGEMVVLS